MRSKDQILSFKNRGIGHQAAGEICDHRERLLQSKSWLPGKDNDAGKG